MPPIALYAAFGQTWRNTCQYSVTSIFNFELRQTLELKQTMEINLPEVIAEVKAVFERYEAALMNNDIAVLNELFWHDSFTIRYGVTENLYGYEAIAAFRSSRSPKGLQRTLSHTIITTFGRNFATVNTEFYRSGQAGRQSQTWLNTSAGWRVVSAHVSLLPHPSQ